MNTDSRFGSPCADNDLARIGKARNFAVKLCCGLSILSAGASFSTQAFGTIVGEAGVGGVGGAANGGNGGDGGDGYAAMDITTSYTTYDDVEGAPGGGGGGGGGGGLANNVGGGGGAGGGGGHGIVISGDGVVLHNDGWSISGGKGGGGGGGGGGTYSNETKSSGGKGGDGAGGAGGGAGGGGGGGADINPGGVDGTGFGGDGGNGGEDGLPGGGDSPGACDYAGGGGGGGGGTATNGGSGGDGAIKSTSPGVGALGGIAGGAPGAGGGSSGALGYGGGGGGGGAPGGAGGVGGKGSGYPGGPPGGAGGTSGYGVYVTGSDSVIINSGKILYGPVNQDTAIKFAGSASNSTLVLQEGSEIVGLVDATESAGQNALVLDGGAAQAFDVSKIGGAGGQYLGFSAFEKTSSGTWSLTGAPGQALTPWTLSGGWLAINDDASLGDSAGAITFNGGGLRLDTSVTSLRDMHLAGDGAVSTADGTVSLMEGTFSGAGAFTKTGAGVLIVGAENMSTGATLIDEGVLQIGAGDTAGSLGSGSVVNNAILAFDRSDDVTVSNAISGAGELRQAGSGSTTLTGPLTYTGITRITKGTLAIDSTTLGDPDNAVARVVGLGLPLLALSNGATLNGWIDGPSVVIDSSSQWNILTDSTNPAQGNNLSFVYEVTLAGGIKFETPAVWTNDAIGRTFTANNLVGAEGEVQLQMIPKASGTNDYVSLRAGATGLTNVSFNSSGPLGDSFAGNGRLVVRAGANTDNAFQQTPGQPTRGGAYNYVLLHGAKDGAAAQANNWYLRSEVRPEVSIYSQLGNQALRQSELTVGTFNERMGATETLARKVYPFAWARTLVALENRDDAPTGILQSRVAADSKIAGLQLGTDLFVVNKGISRRSVGVFGSAVTSRNDVNHYRESTRSKIDAGRSDQTTYGLGGYYTVIDGKGGYADFVTQISRYGVKTVSRGPDGVSMKTSGWGGALSAEVGKAFSIGTESAEFRIEPQAQVMYQHVRLRDADDGVSRVSLPGVDALHSRVSLKLSKAWGDQSNTASNGWLMLSYLHTMGKSTSSYATLTQGDVSFDSKLDGSRLGLRAGYERGAGRNTFVNVQLNAEYGLGSTSALRGVGGTVGIKHLF